MKSKQSLWWGGSGRRGEVSLGRRDLKAASTKVENKKYVHSLKLKKTELCVVEKSGLFLLNHGHKTSQGKLKGPSK